MIQISKHGLWRSLAIGLLVASGCSISPQKSRVANSRPNVDTIITALGSHRLRLTAAAESDSTRFDVRLRWSARSAAGSAISYECIVARDGNNAAIVLLSPGGLPFCYMAPDLLLMVGTDGQVVTLTHGAPTLEFARIADQDRFQATAAFLRTPHDAAIMIDLGSILDGLIHKATRREIDADGRKLYLHTDRAEATIGIVSDCTNAAFPLDSLSVRSANGATALVDNIHRGQIPSLPLHLTVADAERSQIRMALSLASPHGFSAAEFPA